MNRINNDYYSIACEDLRYLISSLHSGAYNNIVVLAQQVAEKMLKDVLQRVSIEAENELRGHNLRQIYNAILRSDDSIEMNKSDLAFLTDYYFDARYPGDNFENVTKDDCNKCISIMYSVIEEVNDFRKSLDLPIIVFKKEYADDSKAIYFEKVQSSDQTGMKGQ